MSQTTTPETQPLVTPEKRGPNYTLRRIVVGALGLLAVAGIGLGIGNAQANDDASHLQTLRDYQTDLEDVRGTARQIQWEHEQMLPEACQLLVFSYLQDDTKYSSELEAAEAMSQNEACPTHMFAHVVDARKDFINLSQIDEQMSELEDTTIPDAEHDAAHDNELWQWPLGLIAAAAVTTVVYKYRGQLEEILDAPARRLHGIPRQ